jgi:hypothetical protein
MIALVRPNLNDEEMREVEELITEYEGSFATKALAADGPRECTTVSKLENPD